MDELNELFDKVKENSKLKRELNEINEKINLRIQNIKKIEVKIKEFRKNRKKYLNLKKKLISLNLTDEKISKTDIKKCLKNVDKNMNVLLKFINENLIEEKNGIKINKKIENFKEIFSNSFLKKTIKNKIRNCFKEPIFIDNFSCEFKENHLTISLGKTNFNNKFKNLNLFFFDFLHENLMNNFYLITLDRFKNIINLYKEYNIFQFFTNKNTNELYLDMCIKSLVDIVKNKECKEIINCNSYEEICKIYKIENSFYFSGFFLQF